MFQCRIYFLIIAMVTIIIQNNHYDSETHPSNMLKLRSQNDLQVSGLILKSQDSIFIRSEIFINFTKLKNTILASLF